MNRKYLLLTASALAILLAFASVAWACITVKGEATIVDVKRKAAAAEYEDCAEGEACAHAGDVIVAAAKGAIGATEYYLHMRQYTPPGWSDQLGDSCWGYGPTEDTRVSKKSVTSSRTGKIRAVKGIVPDYGSSNAVLGPVAVCFVDTEKNIYTNSDYLTII
ncbi:MAG TPA: hypothetical protein VM784_10420 [Actinomycetota bacterium]|nr:hypothetical protein [Actinomycetota bacterium]